MLAFFTLLKGSIRTPKKFIPKLFKVLYPKVSALYLVHLENVPEKVIWCIFQLVKISVWLREGRRCDRGEDVRVIVLSGVSGLMCSHIQLSKSATEPVCAISTWHLTPTVPSKSATNRKVRFPGSVLCELEEIYDKYLVLSTSECWKYKPTMMGCWHCPYCPIYRLVLQDIS